METVGPGCPSSRLQAVRAALRFGNVFDTGPRFDRHSRLRPRLAPARDTKMKTAGDEQAATVHQAARSAAGRRWITTKLPVVTGMILAGVLASAGLVFLFSPKPDPDRLWSNAEFALQTGRFNDAEAMLRTIRALRKPTPQDLMLTAQIASATGRNDDAMKALREIPEDHPLGSQAWYMIGRIERERSRIHKAEIAYRKALELNPSMVPAHRELIYIYGMQLRRPELEAEYNALSQLAPLSHRDLFTRGITHFIGWSAESADQLETFIKADPEDRYSRLALADMLVGQPGAQAKVEEVLAPLGPDDLDATAFLIELKLNRGEADQAMAILDATKGRNARLSRLRGRIALMKRDSDAAIVHFQNALNDQPFDRAALAELSKALTIKGDTKAAESVIDRVRKLDDVYNLINRITHPGRENKASDLAALGHAFEAAGMPDEAKGWYLLAIGHDPLDADSQRALQRLRARSAQ